MQTNIYIYIDNGICKTNIYFLQMEMCIRKLSASFNYNRPTTKYSTELQEIINKRRDIKEFQAVNKL